MDRPAKPSHRSNISPAAKRRWDRSIARGQSGSRGSSPWRHKVEPMRIAELKAHVLEAQLSQAFAWSFTGTAMRTSCVVEVICEDGTTGWGECFGPARLNAPILAAFRPHVIGMDALASEQIWQHLYSQ